MPTCVECGYPVTELYHEFGASNIRLTKCVKWLPLCSRVLSCLPPPMIPISSVVGCFQDHCLQFADRYVEYDGVMIFIDMVLHKPRVYRHLLFNRIKYHDTGFDVRRPLFPILTGESLHWRTKTGSDPSNFSPFVMLSFCAGRLQPPPSPLISAISQVC